MVLECSSAETGVGATIAPRSQLWNGNWADLANPARQSSPMGSSAAEDMTAARVSPPVCRRLR